MVITNPLQELTEILATGPLTPTTGLPPAHEAFLMFSSTSCPVPAESQQTPMQQYANDPGQEEVHLRTMQAFLQDSMQQLRSMPHAHTNEAHLRIIQAHLQDSMQLLRAMPQQITHVPFGPCQKVHELIDNLIHLLHTQSPPVFHDSQPGSSFLTAHPCSPNLNFMKYTDSPISSTISS